MVEAYPGEMGMDGMGAGAGGGARQRAAAAALLVRAQRVVDEAVRADLQVGLDRALRRGGAWGRPYRRFMRAEAPCGSDAKGTQLKRVAGACRKKTRITKYHDLHSAVWRSSMHVLPHLQGGAAVNPLLVGRVMWLAARLAPQLRPDQRPTLLAAAAAGLNSGLPMPVKIGETSQCSTAAKLPASHCTTLQLLICPTPSLTGTSVRLRSHDVTLPLRYPG